MSGPSPVEIEAVAYAARLTDRVAPLSEGFLLAVDDPAAAARAAAQHVVATPGGVLVGYGQVQGDGSAEVVVHPEHRGLGHGRALLAALAERGARRVWAHGTVPAAVAFAGRLGLVPVRALHLMTRPVAAGDTDPVELPPGFAVRAFRPGADDDAWVAANAAAFADHPEQGALTVADLRVRTAQPWFDPAGLLLVEDVTAAEPVLAAFHWTKVADPATGEGEVYVVGVHPVYQGRGLGGPVTRLGLAHLARRGVRDVVLYVDGDNARALATYRRLGFTDRSLDTMYAVPARM